jgi:hypothetical protein
MSFAGGPSSGAAFGSRTDGEFEIDAVARRFGDSCSLVSTALSRSPCSRLAGSSRLRFPVMLALPDFEFGESCSRRSRSSGRHPWFRLSPSRVLLRGEALEADGLWSTDSLIDGLADASGRKDVCRWLSLLTAVNPEAGGSSCEVGKPCGTCPF